PSEISDTENLSLIRSTAESLNIRGISLSPDSERSNGFYFVKPYTFSAKGTFLQFLIFFERIGESTRLFNIRELKFQRSREEQRGRFQLIEVSAIIEAYRYNQNHKESRDIEDIQEQIE